MTDHTDQSNQDNNDRFTQHQSNAGKVGGASKSDRKRAAARTNAAKARAARYRPPVLVGQPQPTGDENA